MDKSEYLEELFTTPSSLEWFSAMQFKYICILFFSVMSLLFLADPMSLAHSKWCRQCFEWNYREMNVSNITLKEGASSEHDFQLMFVLGKKKNSEFVNNSNNKYKVWTHAYHMLDLIRLIHPLVLFLTIYEYGLASGTFQLFTVSFRMEMGFFDWF